MTHGDEGDSAAETVGDESRTLGYKVARAALTTFIPGGELLAVLVDHEQQRLLRISGAFVDEIGDAAGAQRLVRRVEESEEVAAVFRQAVDAASRTGYEAKRRALARIVSAAVLDDAKVDESHLLTHALQDLDAPHFRVLEAMHRAEVRVRRAHGDADYPDRQEAEIEAVRLATEGTPEVVVAGLARVGAIADRGTWSSLSGRTCEAHETTDFGRLLLEYLRADGPV